MSADATPNANMTNKTSRDERPAKITRVGPGDITQNALSRFGPPQVDTLGVDLTTRRKNGDKAGCMGMILCAWQSKQKYQFVIALLDVMKTVSPSCVSDGTLLFNTGMSKVMPTGEALKKSEQKAKESGKNIYRDRVLPEDESKRVVVINGTHMSIGVDVAALEKTITVPKDYKGTNYTLEMVYKYGTIVKFTDTDPCEWTPTSQNAIATVDVPISGVVDNDDETHGGCTESEAMDVADPSAAYNYEQPPVSSKEASVALLSTRELTILDQEELASLGLGNNTTPESIIATSKHYQSAFLNQLLISRKLLLTPPSSDPDMVEDYKKIVNLASEQVSTQWSSIAETLDMVASNKMHQRQPNMESAREWYKQRVNDINTHLHDRDRELSQFGEMLIPCLSGARSTMGAILVNNPSANGVDETLNKCMGESVMVSDLPPFVVSLSTVKIHVTEDDDASVHLMPLIVHPETEIRRLREGKPSCPIFTTLDDETPACDFAFSVKLNHIGASWGRIPRVLAVAIASQLGRLPYSIPMSLPLNSPTKRIEFDARNIQFDPLKILKSFGIRVSEKWLCDNICSGKSFGVNVDIDSAPYASEYNKDGAPLYTNLTKNSFSSLQTGSCDTIDKVKKHFNAVSKTSKNLSMHYVVLPLSSPPAGLPEIDYTNQVLDKNEAYMNALFAPFKEREEPVTEYFTQCMGSLWVFFSESP